LLSAAIGWWVQYGLFRLTFGEYSLEACCGASLSPSNSRGPLQGRPGITKDQVAHLVSLLRKYLQY
jgi:hypothetical protein